VIVGGADGCKGGWAVCRRTADGALQLDFVKTLADACEGLSVLAVDMPIGLLDRPQPGGRDCERAARALLKGKASSVFSSPCRPALQAATYREANAISKRLGGGLSAQAFGLAGKLREVDDLLRTHRAPRRIVREAHPELAFARMNGGAPVLASKKTPGGARLRRRLLAAHGFTPPPVGALPLDDALDAVAVCRTAWLIAQGEATRLGPAAARDSHGLPMHIWF